MSKIYTGENIYMEFWRTIINTILSSDFDWTKIANFQMRPHVYGYRQYKRGKYDQKIFKDTKAFTEAEIKDLKTKIYGSTEKTN